MVNSKTIQGEWVCLDPETRLAYRLRFSGTDSILVVTQGPGSGELVLFGRETRVKNGKIFMRLAGQTAGDVSLIVHGSGNALGTGGTLHLLMEPAPGHQTQWEETELVFLKDSGAPSVLDDLTRSDKRARELLAESTKSAPNPEPTAVPTR
jgi:hypothetical protein